MLELDSAAVSAPANCLRSAKTRSVAALIAHGELGALGYYANSALENGITRAELSETILHLAYFRPPDIAPLENVRFRAVTGWKSRRGGLVCPGRPARCVAARAR
ncbi:MAG: carboxymuconolactone decarboxylase family protein, partial [Steroidobacteraceae bacterium]